MDGTNDNRIPLPDMGVNTEDTEHEEEGKHLDSPASSGRLPSQDQLHPLESLGRSLATGTTYFARSVIDEQQKYHSLK